MKQNRLFEYKSYINELADWQYSTYHDVLNGFLSRLKAENPVIQHDPRLRGFFDEAKDFADKIQATGARGVMQRKIVTELLRNLVLCIHNTQAPMPAREPLSTLKVGRLYELKISPDMIRDLRDGHDTSFKSFRGRSRSFAVLRLVAEKCERGKNFSQKDGNQVVISAKELKQVLRGEDSNYYDRNQDPVGLVDDRTLLLNCLKDINRRMGSKFSKEEVFVSGDGKLIFNLGSRKTK